MRLPMVRPPSLAPGVVQLLSKNGQKIRFRGARFEGNTALKSDVLLHTVEKFIGQKVGIKDLKMMTEVLIEKYVSSGFLANVTLPQQDVTDGVILFRITEARLGKINYEVDETSKGRIHEDSLGQYVEHSNALGDLVVLEQVDRSLLLLDDLGGVSVQGGLQAGRTNNQTDVAFKVQADKRFSGSVIVDNKGPASTGSNRVIAASNFASPFSYGGALDFVALKSLGTEYGRFGYSFPVGYSGLKASVQASAMNYNSSNAYGNSQTTNAELNYPILRGYSQNVYAKVGFSQNTYENHNSTDGSLQSDYNVYGVNAEIYGNKSLTTGAEITYSIATLVGYVDLQGSPNFADDQRDKRIHGRFAKIKGSASLRLQLAQGVRLKLSGNGQLASKNLDSSEVLYLGGAGGVRAYPESEDVENGSDGFLASADVEYGLKDSFVGSFFVDAGRVWPDDDAQIKNRAGYGVGLSYTSQFGVNISGSLSKPIKDKDASEPRLSLVLSMAF